jgi:hypothetical protein
VFVVTPVLVVEADWLPVFVVAPVFVVDPD